MQIFSDIGLEEHRFSSNALGILFFLFIMLSSLLIIFLLLVNVFCSTTLEESEQSKGDV